MFEITPATPADVPELARLLALLFAQEVEFAPEPAKQERALRLILAQPETGRIYCARAEGKVAGMVSLLFTISTAEGGRVAWLEDLIIHPDHRNGGLGRRLIDHVLAEAHALGCTRVTLLTDDTNTGAMRFYERAGFVRSTMVPFRWHGPAQVGAGA